MLKQNMQMRSRGYKTGHKAKQTTHNLKTFGTFNRARTLMPTHTHTQSKQKHTHTVKSKTCINPLTSSCWRWAQAPLCAVWSCAAPSSSPANTPGKQHVFTYYYSQQSQIQPLPTVSGGPPVRRPCRLLDAGQNQLLCLEKQHARKALGCDLTLATANENAALLRDSEEEGSVSILL